MKTMKAAKVKKHGEIGENCWSIWLEASEIVDEVNPGQFIHVKLNNGEKLLPRPLSICETDTSSNTLRLVYAVVGKGTEALSQVKTGETLRILGPLGNGFDINQSASKSIIVGGGMGIPPLLELSKNIPGKKEIYLGYSSTPFLLEEFEKQNADIYVSTDDGCFGYKGTVIDLMRYNNAQGDSLYSCGPKPMLKALSGWAEKNKIPAQVSLEERMACGVGACLVCTCKVKKENENDWKHQRVCADGPVFRSQEVVWDE
ncbi:MAG: dihydroorotate dehydrogenase electron transfer subunit [Tindallia sp. MSAO_Bac2]|nr:MAG: dihydroorotate dehydrogenase electron transfer subunit [Tindallia sp. MSAO_Bac2]